jgi:hypothetical protein
MQRRERSEGAEDSTYAVLVGHTVADVERDLILQTLKHCHGNRTHAANILGISIRTLRNKLNEYSGNGLVIPPPETAGAGSCAAPHDSVRAGPDAGFKRTECRLNGPGRRWRA